MAADKLRKAGSAELFVDVERVSDVDDAEAAAADDDTEDLQQDIGEAGLSCSLSRRRFVGKAYPEGPSTLDECLAWADAGLQSLHWHDSCHKTAFCTELADTINEGIVMTTSYSGTGSAEFAASQIIERSKQALPGISANAKLIVYSATEKWHVAQEVLKAHTQPSKALHRFEDILHRLPDHTFKCCKQMEAKKMNQHKALQDKFNSGDLSKADFMQQKTALGHSLVQGLSGILKTCAFKDHLDCLEHGMRCPVCPRQDPSLASMHWIEVAGSTCCPFSSMSDGSMWLDEATLPCLTWLYSSAYYQPDSILHECVTRFEEKTMRNIVSDEGEDIDGGRRRRASTAPRPTWCNRVRPQCTEGYAVTSIIFSPSQLGIPSDRYRKYTFLNLVGSVALRIHGGHPSVQAQFQEIFFRDCSMDASVYMVATTEMLEKHRRAAADARGEAFLYDWLLAASLGNREKCTGKGFAGADGAIVLLPPAKRIRTDLLPMCVR